MAYVSNEELFPVWQEPRSFWERTGLTPEQRRRFDQGLVALVVLLLGGWIFAAVQAVQRGEAPAMARRIGGEPSLLSADAPPPATFLLETAITAFVDWDDAIRGQSGELNVVINDPGDSLQLPESALPSEVEIAYQPVGEEGPDTAGVPAAAGGDPPEPGVWNVLLRARNAVRAVPNLNVITLVPAGEVREGRLGGYRIGSWPSRTGVYAPPRGFVRVTPENMNTYVSTHFQLKDFLTKGQENVWPKYVVLSTRLLDKLELTLQELEAAGHPVENVFVVSGFRTPWYNASGGNTQGRGALSRHMYGDASDIAIDNDRDGRMDDLNGDGTVNVRDARIIAEAAQRVEQKYPTLVGGIGIYRPTGGHNGMVHIDTRGSRARWGAW
jgi:hypothetical protein